MTTTQFRTSYMDNAVFNLETTLREACKVLRPVSDEFDTLVGTGFSGGLVIPALALRLHKKFVLIRKEGDDSHHGPGRLLGTLGERWIFVDDFVSSGATRERVIEKITYAANIEGHRTRHVGNYYYAKHIERNYVREDS